MNDFNQKERLEDFIDTLIKSEEISVQSKMNFLEHFIELSIGLKCEAHFIHALEAAELNLLELYKSEGKFQDCIRCAQHLKILSQDTNIQYMARANIIECAALTGNLELEAKTISELIIHTPLDAIEKPWYYMLRFFSKTNAKASEALIDQLLNELSTIQMEKQKFNILEQAVMAYFYLGQIQKALSLMAQIEKEFAAHLDETNPIGLAYQHKMSLILHNLDKNEKVVTLNKILKEAYKKRGKTYNYFVACLNLGDGYIGIGDFAKAEQTLEALYHEAKQSPWIYGKNMIAICYANALLNRGKISIAFELYEEGITDSNTINFKWDACYGKIWRMLALAEFGDGSALQRLADMRLQCESEGFLYLRDLATCFFLLSSWILKKPLPLEEAHPLLQSIHEKDAPGLKAQAIAVILLTQKLSVTEETDLFQQMLSLLLSCEGIKGKPGIFSSVYDKKKASLGDDTSEVTQASMHQFNDWLQQYVRPAQEDWLSVNGTYLDGLERRPLLRSCNPADCKGMCCYDGVYLREGEEEKIAQFVSQNKDYFHFLPERLFMDGNWKGLVSGRKTAVRACVAGEDAKYPAHFEKTKCVFSLSNGLCSLQKLATDLDLHPWKIKPKTCWMFPVHQEKEIPQGPPNEDQADPHFVDASYPGYMKFLPCCTERAQGTPWFELFKQEIIYQEHIKTTSLSKDAVKREEG